MKKVKVQLFVFLIFVLLVSIGTAGEHSFKAKLFGFEEVPKVTTPASDEAEFRNSAKMALISIQAERFEDRLDLKKSWEEV